MSGKISGQVWDLDLPHNEAFVLLAICDKVDHDGRNAHPGVDLLAWMTGYGERQVRRILQQLEEKGILIRRGRGGSAAGFAVYDVDFSGVPLKPLRRRAATRKPSGQNVRLNLAARRVERPASEPDILSGGNRTFLPVAQPDILTGETGHFEAGQPDIFPQTASSHLFTVDPSMDPSYRSVLTPPTPPPGGVCVGTSRFDLDTCQQYAHYLQLTRQGIRVPGAYGKTIWRSGEDDSKIDEWVELKRDGLL